MSINWAGLLDGVSRGLFALGKEKIDSERADANRAHEDRRDAMNRSFQENLARFQVNAETARDTARAGQERELHAQDAAARERLEGLDRASREKIAHEENAAAAAYRSASLGIEARRLDNDTRRADAADKRADETARRAEAADKQKNATTALASMRDDLRIEQEKANALAKELGNPATAALLSPDDLKAKKAELQGYKDNVNTLQTDMRNLRKGAGFESGMGADDAGVAVVTDPSKLAPDRQQLYQDLLQKNPKMDPGVLLKRVQAVPQETLDSAIQSRPAPTAGAGGSTDFIPAPPGGGGAPDALDAATPPATQPGASGAPSADMAATMGAPAAPAAPAPAGAPEEMGMSEQQPTDETQVADAGATDAGMPSPDEGGEQQPGADFDAISQQLQQTPEGQGIHTTLDRLAQVGEGPAADKLRRTAQIQLQQQFPDIDADSYIDQYLSQQTEEPAYA
jgi:hypothetical protein